MFFNEKKTIAILITCHNRCETTIGCMESLHRAAVPQDYDMYIFLVDDGSTDSTYREIKRRYPWIKIIKGNGNLYWNRGMVCAWEAAAQTKDYDYYLWLNDDTTVYQYVLEELVGCSASEDDRKIICGSTCATDCKDQVTYGGRLRKRGLITPNGKKQRCDYFNGNAVLIPKYVFDLVGTNDPIFRHALGDFDYGLRAAALGVESIVSPHFIGECDVHARLPAWCNPETPLRKRLSLLYTPLGNHPFEFFIYEKRHNGLFWACFHFITNHARAVFPSFWLLFKKMRRSMK